MSQSFTFRKDNIVGMVITLSRNCCYGCRGCQKLSVVFVLTSHWTFLLIKAHASHIFGRNCQFSFRIDLCWIAPLLWRRNAVGDVDLFVVTLLRCLFLVNATRFRSMHNSHTCFRGYMYTKVRICCYGLPPQTIAAYRSVIFSVTLTNFFVYNISRHDNSIFLTPNVSSVSSYSCEETCLVLRISI